MVKLEEYIDVFATEDGKIVKETGEEHQFSVSEKGYTWITVKKLNGDSINIGRYRLICKAFKPFSDREVEDAYVVNHIDGDKTNDVPSNLQWITTQENSLHATLLGARNKRPLIRCYVDGDDEPILYMDLHDAVKSLELTYEEVWESIRLDKPVGKYIFCHVPWNFKDVLQGRLVLRAGGRTPTPRPIDTINVFTKEVKSYPTMNELAEELGILKTHVRIRICNKENPKILHMKYVVVDAGYGFDWLTDEVIQMLLKRGAKKMLAYHKESKVFTVYKSAYNFIKTHKLKHRKKHITEPLARGVIKQVEGWYFHYLQDSEEVTKQKILDVAH